MAIIPGFTLIRAISLFHFAAAYLFFVQPSKIGDQSLVYVLGEAMQLPHITAFNTRTPATAFIAILLAFLGASDLSAAALSEDIARPYWAAVVPVRLLFLFGVTGYTYTFKHGGVFGPKGAAAAWRASANQSAGEQLKNSFIFTWGFLETVVWFWIFITLRDERRQAGIRMIEKRKKDAEAWHVKET